MNHSNPIVRALPCLAATIVIALAGCRAPAPPDAAVVGGMPSATLRLSGEQPLTLEVELALTPVHQARGLMEVSEIPDTYGMVFLWSEPGLHAFFMKNTLIPLDIAWWNDRGEIVDIQTMTPCTEDPCTLYEPAEEHIAAVEVNAGLLAANGVRVGDTAQLETPDG